MANLFPRRKATPVALPHEYTVRIDNVEIQSGQPIKIQGEAGDFVFKYVYLPDGSVTCWGGPKGHEQFRSFPVARCGVRKAPRKKPQFTEEQIAAMTARLAQHRANQVQAVRA